MSNGLLTTFTGRNVDVLNLRSEDICLEDIAHSLALTCRFGGHSKQFYSVAEHSVRVSYLYKDVNVDPRYLLLHDAAEAYLVDVPRPVKQKIPQFKKIENVIIDTIMSRYVGDERWMLRETSKLNFDRIKLADNIMLVTEVRDLMSDSCDVLLDVDELVERIVPWTWEQAEDMFLVRAGVLGLHD